MRQCVVEARIYDLRWGLGGWHAVVGNEGLDGRFEFRGLDPFDDAVDALVSVLLRGSVLLVFLEIGAAAHGVAEAGPRGFGGGTGGF